MADKPTTTVDVNWQGKLEFTSKNIRSHEITVGAPANEGEGFAGFKPGELLMTSLAGCSAIDVVTILQRQRQELTGLEIRVQGVQEPEAPWAYDEIKVEYVVKGRGLKTSAVERAIRLAETKYCSVGATLAGRARISSTYRIVEDGPTPGGQAKGN